MTSDNCHNLSRHVKKHLQSVGKFKAFRLHGILLGSLQNADHGPTYAIWYWLSWKGKKTQRMCRYYEPWVIDSCIPSIRWLWKVWELYRNLSNRMEITGSSLNKFSRHSPPPQPWETLARFQRSWHVSTRWAHEISGRFYVSRNGCPRISLHLPE